MNLKKGSFWASTKYNFKRLSSAWRLGSKWKGRIEA
jgi:hypothetical protein